MDVCVYWAAWWGAGLVRTLIDTCLKTILMERDTAAAADYVKTVIRWAHSPFFTTCTADRTRNIPPIKQAQPIRAWRRSSHASAHLQAHRSSSGLNPKPENRKPKPQPPNPLFGRPGDPLGWLSRAPAGTCS